MKLFIIIYWWIAVTMDWASTICYHSYKEEENPLMRDIWQNYGDLGFSLISLFFGILNTVIMIFLIKNKLKYLVYFIMIPLITFKILIALTNLILIPVWITDWFHF